MQAAGTMTSATSSPCTAIAAPLMRDPIDGPAGTQTPRASERAGRAARREGLPLKTSRDRMTTFRKHGTNARLNCGYLGFRDFQFPCFGGSQKCPRMAGFVSPAERSKLHHVSACARRSRARCGDMER
jgi:hypothetical protein